MEQEARKKRYDEVFSLVAKKPEGRSLNRFGQETKLSTGENVGYAIFKDMRHAVGEYDRIITGQHTDTSAPVDMSFSEFAQDKWGVNFDGILRLAGIDKNKVTVNKLYSLPNLPDDSRYITPIFITEVMRTGLAKPALWADLIRDSITVDSLSVIIPVINLSDAAMKQVAEGESVTYGTIKLDSKTAKISKVGRGFKYTDETFMFSTLNMVTPFLEDLGSRINMSQNAVAIKALLQDIVSIGVKQTGKFQYRDMVYVHAVMKNINRQINAAVSNVRSYTDVMDMDEVKGLVGTRQLININSEFKTLNVGDMGVHSGIPDDSTLFLDKATALRRLVAMPLKVENERIINKQVTEIVATMMVGFTTLMEDSRFLLNHSLDIATNDFPTTWTPDAIESVGF